MQTISEEIGTGIEREEPNRLAEEAREFREQHREEMKGENRKHYDEKDRKDRKNQNVVNSMFVPANSFG